MRKVYQLLMLMVLACIGINTSQAQKRYEVSDLSTPLSIDDFVGEKFVIHNGSLGDSEKDFIKGLEKSVSVTDENLFTVEVVGETAEGTTTYRLKRVSDNTYMTNNGGKLGYTETVSRAWEFYPLEAIQASTDEVNAEEPVISDFRPITTGEVYTNAMVFVDAKATTEKNGAIRLCPNGKEAAPSLSNSNYATNTVLLYVATELNGYEYLEACLNELFPNGDPGELYNSGDQPGCVPTDIYNEMVEAYNAALQLISDFSEDDAACRAAFERCEKAYEKAKASVIQVAEGYYYFRSARGANSVTYEDGSNLRWVEDWTEKEELEPTDAKYIWKLIENPKKAGSYFIQNLFSGRYVGIAKQLYTLVPTTEEPEESFLIYPFTKEYFLIQSTTLLEKPFSKGMDCIHAQVNGHSTVIWQGTLDSKEGSGWKFLHVDESKIDAIRESIAQVQRNEALEKELTSSKEDYANGISYKFDGYASGKLDNKEDGSPMGLVTSLSQISTNAQEGTEGPMNNILDSNIGVGNFFHSSWSNDNFDHQNNYPYLQIDLGKAVKEIAVKMWPRAVSATDVRTNNLPGKIHVLATNTPDDAESWTEIGNFENKLKWPVVKVDEEGNETAGSTNQVSYVRIPFGADYQHVRLEVCTRLGSTADFKTIGLGSACFNLSEIRVFESWLDEAGSLNNGVPADVLKAFTDAMAKAEAELATESATQATIDELTKAHANYLDVFPDPQQAVNALNNAKARVKAAVEGTDLCYFADGAKEATTNALAAIEAEVKEVMTSAEIKTLKDKVAAEMKNFFAKMNLPENGSYVYLVSKTSGKAAEAYVRSAGNGAAKNKWVKDDEYLTNRPEYVWQFINNGNGTYSLRNAANGEYMNTPRVGGSKGVGMSTKADTCTFTIQNDLKTEGTINIVTAENVFYNADPAGPLVTWGEAGGNDNSTFVFVEANADDAFNGEYAIDVAADGVSILTLPLTVTADKNCYSVIGRNENALELENISGEIPAGTPFFYVNTGNEETVAVLLTDDKIGSINFVTEAKTVNGLAGTLAPIDSIHVGYGILYNNKTIVDAAAGDGVACNSGYILPTVPSTTAKGAVQIMIDGKIDAIQNAVVNTEAAVVNVYTLTGVKVRANVKAENAAKNLPAGLYIIGSKKVLVK